MQTDQGIDSHRPGARFDDSRRAAPIDTAPSAPHRALVLGGGGATGNAWLVGLIAGLFDAGLDTTSADLMIGTSAGATTAVQLTGRTPPELFAATVQAAPQRATAGPRARAAAATTDHLERTGRIIAAAADAADMRRRMGAAALELDGASDGSWTSRWRDTVAARLSGREWPERALLITAVDARTGDPVVFDRHGDVNLVDAVAASTSSGAAYRIGDGRYIDGGYRRNENADLATGSDRVLVLSPLGGRTRHPLEWRMQLAAQVEDLQGSGSQVEAVVPDHRSAPLMGVNAMDMSQRPAAARHGYDQGTDIAERLVQFWR